VIIAVALYFILILLVLVNVMQAFEWSVFWAAIPFVLVILSVGGVYMWKSTRRVMLTALGYVGMIALTAVAITLAFPAYEIIFSDSSSNWTANLTQIFFSSIGLYVCGLWIRATTWDQADSLEWLAKFLGGPSLYLTMVSALILCSASLLAMEWLQEVQEWALTITPRFLARGIIPPLTLFLFFWGILLLLSKWWNTFYLRLSINRWESGVPINERSNLDRVRNVMNDANKFEDQMRFLWRRHDESYLVPRYISFATPVLGFIGTVLGISLAADGIRKIIGTDSGLSGLSNELGSAIAPLGIAFDTTLIALSLSIALTLLLALVQRGEERTLTVLERHMKERLRVH